jgi:hypothetical protein
MATAPVGVQQMASSPLEQVTDQLQFPLRDAWAKKVYNIIQSYEILGVATTSTVAATFSANSFAVSSLDQINSLTAVFDQYRVAMVEITYIPVELNYGLSSGLFTSVIDYDDSAALTTVPQALDYSNSITVGGGAVLRRTFVPHMAMAAYSGAFTSFANEGPKWIDAASTGVQHFGVKTAATITTQVVTYNALVRLWTQWRNVR